MDVETRLLGKCLVRLLLYVVVFGGEDSFCLWDMIQSNLGPLTTELRSVKTSLD